jgi:hypothetical protein
LNVTTIAGGREVIPAPVGLGLVAVPACPGFQPVLARTVEHPDVFVAVAFE